MSDAAVVAGIIIILYLFQSTEFSVVFPLSEYIGACDLGFVHRDIKTLSVATFVLFIGVMGKSAQFGFHV